MIEFDVPGDWPDPAAYEDDLINTTVETTLTALREDTEHPAAERAAADYDPCTRWASLTHPGTAADTSHDHQPPRTCTP